MEVDAFSCSIGDRYGLDVACGACLCIERVDVCISHKRADRLCPPLTSVRQPSPAPLLHSITEHITEHRTVSKRAVHRGAQASISRYSPASPVSEKSACGGGEAAAEAAEESASSDCASEVAGDMGSSTAVSMTADMMRCVHRKSEKVREER
jgi:hypothetical protein